MAAGTRAVMLSEVFRVLETVVKAPVAIPGTTKTKRDF